MSRYWLFEPTHVWSVIEGTLCDAHAQLAEVVGLVSFHHRTL